jgi:hypothetical protein
VQSLTDLLDIQRAAEAMLRPLATAAPDRILTTLQPREEDYARAFVGDAVAQARAGYQAFWASPPRGLAKPGQSEVVAVAVNVESLAGESEFPGGYRGIAHLLKPETVWVRFKFLAPGASAGMAYDGLLWLGGRWAWFPKPWRVFDATAS